MSGDSTRSGAKDNGFGRSNTDVDCERGLAFVIPASLAHLASLEPRGLWKPPLSESQITEALRFGQTHYTGEQGLDTDPYDLTMRKPKVSITLGTAFGRIAMYAAACAKSEAEPDRDQIGQLVMNSALVNGFMMRIISRHKVVSVIHEQGASHENMRDVDRTMDAGLYFETCTFPYPDDLGAVQYFELFVPTFFTFGKMAHFTFDFGALH